MMSDRKEMIKGIPLGSSCVSRYYGCEGALVMYGGRREIEGGGGIDAGLYRQTRGLMCIIGRASLTLVRRCEP
jgi:hypothetical protein